METFIFTIKRLICEILERILFYDCKYVNQKMLQATICSDFFIYQQKILNLLSSLYVLNLKSIIFAHNFRRFRKKIVKRKPKIVNLHNDS